MSAGKTNEAEGSQADALAPFDITGLASEIWWDERFTIGGSSFGGRIVPDAHGGETIVRAILKRSGADAMYAAGAALVARWDAPKWKDAPATAAFIADLREALAKANGQ